MKKLIERVVMTLAVAGMVLPAQVMAAQPTTSSAPQVVDVRLNHGALTGRVITSAGQPASTAVAVYSGKTEVARTVSKADGTYAIPGLKAGTYTVATSAGAGVVRAWDGIAPPAAVDSLALVDGSAVRAQLCGGSDCDGCDSCDGCGVGGGNGGKLLLGAAVIGAAAVGIVALADDDDDSSAGDDGMGGDDDDDATP